VGGKTDIGILYTECTAGLESTLNQRRKVRFEYLFQGTFAVNSMKVGTIDLFDNVKTVLKFP
jgi:hypothetical protein